MISDFQRGTLNASDVATVPLDIGLRFVQLGSPATAASFAGDVAIGAPGRRSHIQRITATAETTAVRFVPLDKPMEGLRLSIEGPAADALLRAVARTGAPAPSAEQPVTFLFGADASDSPVRSVKATDDATRPIDPWMVRTVLRMRRDRELAEAARDHALSLPLPEPLRIVVARNRAGAAVVSAAARGGELAFAVAAAPVDFLAVASVRAALVGRRGSADWGEHEPGTLSASELSAWSREPGPVSSGHWRDLGEGLPGDAPLVWFVVLLLLMLENVVRRRRVRGEEIRAEAA